MPLRKNEIFNTAIVGLAAIVSVWLMYVLSNVFLPVLIAFAAAYLVNPIVEALEKKMRRLYAVLAVYVFGAVIAVGVPFFFVPSLISGAASCKVALVGTPDRPGAIERGVVKLEGFLRRVVDEDRRLSELKASVTREGVRRQIVERLKAHVGEISRGAGKLGTGILSFAGAGFRGALVFLLYLLLVPVYAFFFMLNYRRMLEAVGQHLPAHGRATTLKIVRRVDEAISEFVRGRLLIGLILCAAVAPVLWVAGLSPAAALLIGAVTGLSMVVPFLWLFLGAAPAVAIVLFNYDFAVWRLVVVCGAFILVNVLESFLLTPWILGKKIDLHPLFMILAFFVGGELFGLVGVILAVPLAATVKITFEELLLPRIRELARPA